jgi:hypothetical protein
MDGHADERKETVNVETLIRIRILRLVITILVQDFEYFCIVISIYDRIFTRSRIPILKKNKKALF